MSITQQLIRNSGAYWDEYINHTFVKRISNGTLEKECFQHYLKQDYIFLFNYIRAFSLGIYKAENFKQMRDANEIINLILDECNLHINFCQLWGIDEKTLFNTKESCACIAYTRYVLDIGMIGGLKELYTAIAPCAIGYGVIAKNIVENNLNLDNNPYKQWIEFYSCQEYQNVVKDSALRLDSLCDNISESEIIKLQEIFNTATRMECEFWQMGLDLN